MTFQVSTCEHKAVQAIHFAIEMNTLPSTNDIQKLPASTKITIDPFCNQESNNHTIQLQNFLINKRYRIKKNAILLQNYELLYSRQTRTLSRKL